MSNASKLNNKEIRKYRRQIFDKDYMESTIDKLAERIADSWIREKYNIKQRNEAGDKFGYGARNIRRNQGDDSGEIKGFN